MWVIFWGARMEFFSFGGKGGEQIVWDEGTGEWATNGTTRSCYLDRRPQISNLLSSPKTCKKSELSINDLRINCVKARNENRIASFVLRFVWRAALSNPFVWEWDKKRWTGASLGGLGAHCAAPSVLLSCRSVPISSRLWGLPRITHLNSTHMMTLRLWN